MSKPTIVRDYPQLEAIDYRRMVYICPCCDASDMNDFTFWFRKVCTVVLDPQMFRKPACFIIISECPECGTKSWNHYQLYDLSYAEEYIGKEAADAVELEYKRRKAMCEKEWEESLCIKCSNVNDTNMHYLYPWVKCCDGMRTGHCETECEKFEEIP